MKTKNKKALKVLIFFKTKKTVKTVFLSFKELLIFIFKEFYLRLFLQNFYLFAFILLLNLFVIIFVFSKVFDFIFMVNFIDRVS